MSCKSPEGVGDSGEKRLTTIEIETVRAIVDDKEDFLRRHLIPSKTVVDKLLEKNIVGNFVAKQIRGNHQNNHRQVTLLLMSLKTRGVSAFNAFLDVLRETFHGWLADDILNSQIKLPDIQEKPINVVYVRDVINRYSTSASMPNDDVATKRNNGEGPINYTIPDLIPLASRSKKFINTTDKPGNSGYHPNTYSGGRGYHVTQIHGSLRDLQSLFDSESTTTRKSIGVLQQEELTIKALLQQNLREQQELFSRQDALSDIKCQMKQINESATQLYRPEPEADNRRWRLRHLQKTFWSIYSPQ